VAFPWYTWLTWKEEKNVSSMFIFMVIASLLIVIPGALINLNLQHSYQDQYFPNAYQQNDLYNYLYTNNKSFLATYHDSSDYTRLQEVHTKTAEILSAISNIESDMVQESEGEPGKPAVSANQIKQTDNGIQIKYDELSNPFDTGPVRDFIMPGCTSRQKLNTLIAGYESYLSSVSGNDEVARYKKIINPENCLPVENHEENIISLMSALHSLQILKNGILTVESCVFKELVSKN
jgi:hypothetical protein